MPDYCNRKITKNSVVTVSPIVTIERIDKDFLSYEFFKNVDLSSYCNRGVYY